MIKFIKYGFYSDIPIGFNRMIVFDFGYVIGYGFLFDIGWRYAK